MKTLICSYWVNIDPATNTRKHYFLGVVEKASGKCVLLSGWGRIGKTITYRMLQSQPSDVLCIQRFREEEAERAARGYKRTKFVPNALVHHSTPDWWVASVEAPDPSLPASSPLPTAKLSPPKRKSPKKQPTFHTQLAKRKRSADWNF